MARVRFNRPFSYRPKPGVIIAYKATEYTVRRECADQAIAAGAAEEVKATPVRRRGRRDSV